jgi:purine nucleoside permease
VNDSKRHGTLFDSRRLERHVLVMRSFSKLAASCVRGLLFTAAISLLGLSQCAPEPRYVSCDNDAVCHEAGGKYRYCQMSHCVECVSPTDCESGLECRAGRCQEPE